MNTYKDLYSFVSNYKEATIFNWLKDPWQGKDKQESLFRLFAYLNLIEDFREFTVCDGNFNKGTITPNKDKRILFEDSLTRKGDASDLTLIKDNVIIATTSKKTPHGIGGIDISYIKHMHEQYPNHVLRLCILVTNKQDLMKQVEQSEKTSAAIRKLIEQPDTLIYDWTDLNRWFKECQRVYANKTLSDILGIHKVPLIQRLHQKIAFEKLNRACNKYRDVLLCMIQRSGKTIIMGIFACFRAVINTNTVNHLIITTAPNETIGAYIQMFNTYSQFDQFHIVYLNGDSPKTRPQLGAKNIIICSKHFLQSKGIKNTNRIDWLATLNIDTCFIDESHNGGTTELSQRILDTYSSTAKNRVHITATFSKPVHTFGIPEEAWVTWDLEDIQLCKHIDDPDNLSRLVEKHSPFVTPLLQEYTLEDIKKQYSIYPDMHLLTLDLKEQVQHDILRAFANKPDGFSIESILLLQYDEDDNPLPKFQNESAVIKLLQVIFGNTTNQSYFQIHIPGLIDKAKSIADKNGSRWFSTEEPLNILAFLPCGVPGLPIDVLHEALVKLIEEHKLLQEFVTVSVNTKNNSNRPAIDIINDARAVAKNQKKKGVLTFSGKMLSLGVSIPYCDIVLMLNNTESMDTYLQMIFRCMTESPGKKCGFVIDLNLHRAVNVLIEYSIKLFPKEPIKTGVKRILLQRLIQFHTNDWLHQEGGVLEVDKLDIDAIVNKVYKLYSLNIDSYINNVLKLLTFNITVDRVDQVSINTIFSKVTNGKTIQPTPVEDLTKDNPVNKGIVQEQSDVIESTTTNTEMNKDINIISDIMRHLLPLLLILTIHTGAELKTFLDMIDWVMARKDEREILINQLKIWWGKLMNEQAIMTISDIYKKYLAKDEAFNSIFARLKEMFVLAKNNPAELSKLIDKYLTPQEFEKKQNAEVSTPYFLRQDMLNKIPESFWKKPRLVFEPCAGKGGFLLDIVDKFMKGLPISDPDERYRCIVEECLFWADINPTNIWICRLLLDPQNKYNLNYYNGDTLTMKVKDEFVLDGFHAVIGNPPYNNSQNNTGKKGGGDLLWNKFVEKSLSDWLFDKGYLLYVHPSGWRKPESDNSKYKNMFKLMTNNNQMVYLEIHDTKDGVQTFRCGTRYDWYLIKKIKRHTTTKIVDEKGKVYDLDLSFWSFLPNRNFNLIKNLLAENDQERCDIIYSRNNYGSDKKWVSATKTKEFCHPLIHSTPKNGVRYCYSSQNNNGHFGVPKIIFGETGINHPIIDMDGKYGMTQQAMAIGVANIDEARKLESVLTSDNFTDILKSCSWSNYRIDWRMFTYFKKDFWKAFV